MATTRSKTLGCASVSSCTRILRFSDMAAVPGGGRGSREGAKTQRKRRKSFLSSLCAFAPLREPLLLVGGSLRRERVLDRVLLRRDLLDLRLAPHRPRDGLLRRRVVEIVDLGVVLGGLVDEHA